MDKVILMIGTRKGAFILTSDGKREEWHYSDIQFKSWNVMHLTMDPRDQRLHAAVFHDVYGPSTHYSDDLGSTWTQAKQVPEFPRPSRSGRPIGTPEEVIQSETEGGKPETINKIWNITPGLPGDPNVLYAGVEPAALFTSHDRGETWQVVDGLYDHPHRSTWYPGAGGLCLHTILPDPYIQDRMFVAISSGGCYRTDDGGLTWSPYNNNVRADFLPNIYPEYGQCVHKMTLASNEPGLIYQQNHCGIYRSDNAGEDWIDIGEGKLPSRFGFPIAVHPRDPGTVYVVLEESDEYRVSVGGNFAVWRTRNRGETWQRLTMGLPSRAYLVVLRQAMAVDKCKPAGVYIGTSTGQVFFSPNEGDDWQLLADYLPPILSVEIATLE